MQSQYSISGDRKHIGNKEALANQFLVPSWMDSSAAYGRSPVTLSGKRDLLPDNRKYSPGDMFKGATGETPLLTPNNEDKLKYKHPIMGKILELEEAKHYASQCCSDLVLAKTGQMQNGKPRISEAGKKVVDSQRQVSLSRISLIKSFISDSPDIGCDISEQYEKTQKICVSYNRFKSVDERLLCPLQSQYAWVLTTRATPAFEKLLYENAYTIDAEEMKMEQWNILLSDVFQTCPEKEWSYPLLECGEKTLSGHKVAFKRVDFTPSLGADFCYNPEASSTAIEEFEAREPTSEENNILLEYTALIGIFDMNVASHKQSARINTVVQKTIQSSIQSELAYRKDHTSLREHMNLVTMSIKIKRLDETHVLTFMPFAGHEACTVSHILHSQPYVSNPEAQLGILQFPQKITEIKPIPFDHTSNVLTQKAYVCLGSFRNCRPEEQELIKIHVDGMAEIIQEDYELVRNFPAASKVNYEDGIPLARAIKTSCTGWDILTTSFHDTNTVYTVITAINYPPYGTQMPTIVKKTTKPNDKRPAPKNDPNFPPLAPAGTHQASRKTYPRQFSPQVPSAVYQPSHAATTRPRSEDKWRPNLGNRSFHVHGVIGNDPWSENNTVYFVEPRDKKGTLYPEFQDDYKKISADIYQKFHNVWDSGSKFYDNLKNNRDIRTFWQTAWQTIIKDTIEKMIIRKTSQLDDRYGYWYSSNLNVWEIIIPNTYKRNEYLKFVNASKVGKPIMRTSMSDTIPLPRRLATAPSKPVANPDMARMQARIQALESKLDTSRQEANNAHLLKQVLSKLAR